MKLISQYSRHVFIGEVFARRSEDINIVDSLSVLLVILARD